MKKKNRLSFSGFNVQKDIGDMTVVVDKGRFLPLVSKFGIKIINKFNLI